MLPIETHNTIKPSKSSPAKPHRPRWRFQQNRKYRQKTDATAVYSTTAGGIIYRRRGRSVEIFFIKDPFNRWTFPKGKQRTGENLIATAEREIAEETGLTGLTYIAPLGRTNFKFRREVGIIQKVVHYFLFEAPSDAHEKLATPEEAKAEDKEPIFEAKWVPMDKAFFISGYKNSDHLLARAFRIIGTKLQ